MNIEKLYEYYIILYYYYNYNDIKKLNDNNYDLDNIYDYVNRFYYDNFDDFLDINNEENKNKLYNFLNDIFRFYLLKNNIEDVYDILNNENDNYILNNLNKITELVEKTYYNTKKYQQDSVINISRLSHKELDKHFIDYLLSIDNSHEYLEIYNSIKENNRILYLDLLNDDKKNMLKSKLNITDSSYNDFFFRVDGSGGFIILDRKGTIEDFSKLAHEFAHFVTFNNVKNFENNNLQEFPAIFYEKLANIFLIDRGMDKECVKHIIFDRKKYIHNISFYLSRINIFLNIYIKNNLNINEQLIKEQIEKCLTNENCIIDLCDFVNYILTVNPDIIRSSYSYIIGDYFSDKYINRYLSGENVLDEMKYITKNSIFMCYMTRCQCKNK